MVKIYWDGDSLRGRPRPFARHGCGRYFVAFRLRGRRCVVDDFVLGFYLDDWFFLAVSPWCCRSMLVIVLICILGFDDSISA